MDAIVQFFDGVVIVFFAAALFVAIVIGIIGLTVPWWGWIWLTIKLDEIQELVESIVRENADLDL